MYVPLRSHGFAAQIFDTRTSLIFGVYQTNEVNIHANICIREHDQCVCCKEMLKIRHDRKSLDRQGREHIFAVSAPNWFQERVLNYSSIPGQCSVHVVTRLKHLKHLSIWILAFV